jgi:hypothetical protein
MAYYAIAGLSATLQALIGRARLAAAAHERRLERVFGVVVVIAPQRNNSVHRSLAGHCTQEGAIMAIGELRLPVIGEA